MRTWFITGASRGFGALITKHVLDAGDNVVSTARNPQSILDAVGEQERLLVVALDVTDTVQAATAVEEAVQRFGSIDILLNNAGYGLLGAVEEATSEEVEKIYRTNVFGLLNITRAILPQMRHQRSGHILNISSIGGYRAGAGFGVYCSTKFAVEGLSEALAEELAPLGIKVTIVEPGYFRTDFLDTQSLVVSQKRINDYNTSAGATRQREARVSHHQPGDPQKFAAAIVKIAGDPTSPLRIPFGSDTVAAIEAKNAFVTNELSRWKEFAISTDF